jgi:hypothetical protein
MKSRVITPPDNQLTLVFEPGLAERHLSLRDCVASGVYQRGLGRVAIDLNKAPGNLSVELSEDATRKFSVDSLESYIEKTGDVTPIHYLIDKFFAGQGQHPGPGHGAAGADLGAACTSNAPGRVVSMMAAQAQATYAAPQVAFVPQAESGLDHPKNINYGCARVIYAQAVGSRPMGWVLPGGLRTSDYSEAFSWAVRMDALLGGTR